MIRAPRWPPARTSVRVGRARHSGLDVRLRRAALWGNESSSIRTTFLGVVIRRGRRRAKHAQRLGIVLEQRLDLVGILAETVKRRRRQQFEKLVARSGRAIRYPDSLEVIRVTKASFRGSYRDDVIVAGTSSVEHEPAEIVIIGHHRRLPGWSQYPTNCGSALPTWKLNVSTACSPPSNSVLW